MRTLVVGCIATGLAAGCVDDPTSWRIVDAPAAAGVDLVFAQSHGDAIWVTGWRSGEEEPTLLHYDGARWSRLEADLTLHVTVAAPDSFWTNGITEVQTELLHSTDLVSWAEIDLAAETGLPITAAEVLFADGDSVWVRAYTASATVLLHSNGADWSDVTPPRLADVGPVALGGCRRADDDLWLTASWRTVDDFRDGWSGHLDGLEWSDVDVPGGIVSCRAGELFARVSEELSLAPGERVYRQDGTAWMEVEFAEEWRSVFDVAAAGSAGELWLLGWSQDLDTRLAVPRIWRVDGNRAHDTLGGSLGLEILEPRLDGVGALHAIVSTENGKTFAFGEDGLILEHDAP